MNTGCPASTTRLPRRSAIVAFSAEEVYAIAELIRRQRGGAAVVLGDIDGDRAVAVAQEIAATGATCIGTYLDGADEASIRELVDLAVTTFGGFLGIGAGHHPLPWEALSYDPSLRGFRTDVTEQQLRDAPEFSDQSWASREWEQRVHEHYGRHTY